VANAKLGAQVVNSRQIVGIRLIHSHHCHWRHHLPRMQKPADRVKKGFIAEYRGAGVEEKT
jgi:hypothetical protein